jgi:hypothetical protein
VGASMCYSIVYGLKVPYENEIIWSHIVHTWTVRRVLSSSRGYMHSVELTPATAPAIDEAGIGIFDCSPALGVKCFLTVSYANNCTSFTCFIEF